MPINDLDSPLLTWHRNYWTEPGDYLLSAHLYLYDRKPDGKQFKDGDKKVKVVLPSIIELVSPTIKLQVAPAR